MDHLELVAQLKTLARHELRSDKPELFEVVFKKEMLSQFAGILEPFFGKPLKLSGENPSPEVKKRAGAYGGIQKHQTLYFAEREGHRYLAMLWPWGNEILITLKLIRET